MVARSILLLFVVGIAHSQDMVAWAEEEQTQRTFSECFLYRMGDGSVYIGEPLVSLGMIEVKAFPPKAGRHAAEIRESAQPAEGRTPLNLPRLRNVLGTTTLPLESSGFDGNAGGREVKTLTPRI
jgi:hypothetical protein